jgi:formyltetrahydrofolate synthetase
MGVPKFDSPEEEIKKWLNHIALICLSEDFQDLKKELEKIYMLSDVENVQLAAFQDALYAFLAQEEDELACQTGAN